ncbi:MAG TPA: hypothetical protein VKA79_04365 [Aestuariivirgaceae bacterium]|nr:hypothetical protein [Aestuariivirgaceae bacterium]
MDIPHHELLELAKAFVAQATPIVREQERLIDHLHDDPQDSRLVRRLLATVATASDALAEQQVLIEQLDQSSDGEQGLQEAS